MSDIKKIRIGGVDYDLQSSGLTMVTYAELKEMRDNGGLAAGHLYRITDYEFTTKQSNTKSAGHPFDVIVLATAENQLSELARAIQHEGDTYFDGNDLGAWELWYDLDNDTNKYEWADADNGKGVIYRMIDEKRNNCPYDFKNTLFYNTKLTTSTTTDKYYYTFSYVVSSKLYDGTVEKQVMDCYNNSMAAYIKNSKKSLNLNVFRNTSFDNDCHSNTFGNNCYSNTFNYYCTSNTFGNNCYNNVFGNICNSNTFGNSCYSNTLGNSSDYNKFGNKCYSNTFGNMCKNNTFGNECQKNKFVSYCYNNIFGYECDSNTFGENCSSNTFGENCSSNTFGNKCYSNTFGNGCANNTFGNSCEYNSFENKVCSIELNSAEKTSIILNDEYYDDGSGQLVPLKHPDLSTQPSILPYKFMGQYVYEQLIPVKAGDRIVNCDFMVERPMILSAGVFGVNSFKNVDIIATKSNSLLLNTEGVGGYINIKYTDGSQLLSSNGYGYGYADNNTESESPILIDFGVSPDGTQYIYDYNTETLSLYKSGEITLDSVPQNLPAKNVILGENVTSIGSSTFYNCSSLTDITIPEGVTSIGSSAFGSCSSLTSITIPEGVTSIGSSTFYNCSSLTSITIPEDSQLTSIGERAFSNCKNLTTINIPAGVTSIENGTFNDCSKLTTINIPAGVTNIGNSTFTNCSNLQSIVFEEGSQLRSIGNASFAGSGLTSIIIPASVTSIGQNAFISCSNLKTVINYSDLTLQKGSTSNGHVAYYADRVINYAFKTIDGVHYLTGYIGDDAELTLPTDYQGENYQIGDSAFQGCSSLTSITIPASVTSIGNKVFDDCTSLKEVIFSDGSEMLSLGYNAYGSWNPGQGLFYDCPLESVYLGRNLSYSDEKSYGYSPFYNKTELSSVVIGDTVTSVGKRAFDSCSNLQSIVFEEGSHLTSIDSNAFYLCSALTSINIPESVVSVGDGAFRSCKNLTSINIPENSQLTNIVNGAFKGCSSLTAVTIPASVTSIGDNAFYGCSNLQSIVFEEGSHLTSIRKETFYDCSKLTTINIPEGVISIGDYAFQNCSNLTTINIPESVTSIGGYAFASCSGLTSITCESITPPTVSTNTFNSVSKSIPVYVLEESIDIYKAASGWSEFTNIQAI